MKLKKIVCHASTIRSKTLRWVCRISIILYWVPSIPSYVLIHACMPWNCFHLQYSLRLITFLHVVYKYNKEKMLNNWTIILAIIFTVITRCASVWHLYNNCIAFLWRKRLRDVYAMALRPRPVYIMQPGGGRLENVKKGVLPTIHT